MPGEIKFTLNGETVKADPGETIWQVANRVDIEIPHLCYTPEVDYRPDGNCRACMVEIEGERVLAASCLREPAEGMDVSSGALSSVPWYQDGSSHEGPVWTRRRIGSSRRSPCSARSHDRSEASTSRRNCPRCPKNE